METGSTGCKRILILATHPDDEVLSFGGLIRREVEAGSFVEIVYFCVGGPASNAPAEVRKAEIEDVTHELGLYPNHIIYYEEGKELDGLLEYEPNCAITGFIDKIVNQFKPHELYCSALSEHQDHQALYKAFLASCRVKGGWMPNLVAVGTYPFSDQLYTMPEGGKLFLPMTPGEFERKALIFSRYKSQNKPSPSLLNAEGLKLKDAYNGLMCGHPYAELCYIIRMIK